jgi:asparagine synthase (glutamine-hydrolysing)
MFAIALWDPTRMRLLLARDRLGVKPLYWAEVPGGIVYGSEPGAILASGLHRARPDPVAIMQYLTLQYVPPTAVGIRRDSQARAGGAADLRGRQTQSGVVVAARPSGQASAGR